jgi:Zn-dependent peptidase ImmA (M78 family)
MIIRDHRGFSPAGYTIHVNADDNPARQRFTIAHEIAHYVLHRDLIGDGITDDPLYRSSLGEWYERQANKMAADILMPPKLVRAMYRSGTVSLAPLARAFEVSVDAMRIRLEELGFRT